MNSKIECPGCKNEFNSEDMIKISGGSYICHECASTIRETNWMIDPEHQRPSEIQ
jgi:transposase-like protein